MLTIYQHEQWCVYENMITAGENLFCSFKNCSDRTSTIKCRCKRCKGKRVTDEKQEAQRPGYDATHLVSLKWCYWLSSHLSSSWKQLFTAMFYVTEMCLTCTYLKHLDAFFTTSLSGLLLVTLTTLIIAPYIEMLGGALWLRGIRGICIWLYL